VPAIPAAGRDHQQRLSLTAHFVVQVIPFCPHAAALYHHLLGCHVVHVPFGSKKYFFRWINTSGILQSRFVLTRVPTYWCGAAER
jgi:hypothetical protein